MVLITNDKQLTCTSGVSMPPRSTPGFLPLLDWCFARLARFRLWHLDTLKTQIISSRMVTWVDHRWTLRLQNSMDSALLCRVLYGPGRGPGLRPALRLTPRTRFRWSRYLASKSRRRLNTIVISVILHRLWILLIDISCTPYQGYWR